MYMDGRPFPNRFTQHFSCRLDGSRSMMGCCVDLVIVLAQHSADPNVTRRPRPSSTGVLGRDRDPFLSVFWGRI